MPQISQSVTVNRPVNMVFRTVADMNKAESWQPDVTEASMSDEKMRVGVMLTQRRTTRVLGWQLDLNADVLDYQPNSLIRLQGVIGRFPATVTYTFESRGGATQVTETVDARMGCLFTPFSPLVSAALNSRARRALDMLKQTQEAGTGSTQVTDFSNLNKE